MTHRALVLAGPTAVGKSSLALDVAEALGAEIVSADSRQLYRGLDIGTAKPSAADRERVPHHLVDLIDPGDRITAGRWLEMARGTIERLWAQGTPVVVVGGSTLYVHALLEGLANLPPVPPALEAQLLEAITEPEGAQRLFEELSRSDPEAAATLDPTKSHRLVRWVGVLRSTGRRPSELWAESQRAGLPSRLVVLDRPRPELYARIDARVDGMLDSGLVDEVTRLASDSDARPTLRATIGYQEWLPVLAGERSAAEAVRLIKRNSRRYAKRQLTWYRRYPDASWLDARSATAEAVLDVGGEVRRA
ncbi:tRNA (adenosine(37)-N6)-dimethylallyltransferase MiaA [Rubrivirga sp. IMCC45206]|uniref:tRNA (adenosine(37)-N6)-dimethylallyltransferase MiaA n=1 Tax=Rubrivirga sp. IMCC45206 TaxID=3391614 RepID=UPI00399036AA